LLNGFFFCYLDSFNIVGMVTGFSCVFLDDDVHFVNLVPETDSSNESVNAKDADILGFMWFV